MNELNINSFNYLIHFLFVDIFNESFKISI